MTAILHEVPNHPQALYRMTVDQYHRMIEWGSIRNGEPFELLDGHLVRKIRGSGTEDPMAVTPEHATSVKLVARVDAKLQKLGCHVRTQQPISLPPYDEPEPDGAIVKGQITDYSSRHPTARDVLCVVEVADASLSLDRGYKQRIYANAAIPMYVIINPPDKVVEVYTEPMRGKGRYGRSTTLTPGQKLVLPTARGRALFVAVKQLLP